MPMSPTLRSRVPARDIARAAFALVVLFSACAAPTGRVGNGEPVTGEWGGEHISLSLTADGGVVEYDCAHGGLSEPIRPDARGEFQAAGVHVREHGGPVRLDERPDSIPARYTGTVRGTRMTVQVFTATDSLGPFSLVRNAAPRLLKCL